MGHLSPKLGVRYAENTTVATLTDEKILEEADIQSLDSAIMPLIEQNKGSNLVIDFSNVQFLSSAVLGLLIRVSKKVYESEGRLKLCGINPKILAIFKITRLDRVFDICETQDQAVKAFD